MGLDLSSSKAVLLPLAMAGLLGGGLFLASEGTPPATGERVVADPAPEAQRQSVAKTGDGTRGPLRAGAPRALGRAARPPAGQLEKVVSASWGGKLGQLGHDLAQEGAALGPTSFVVDSAGAVHVLDAVNSRVVVFDGGVARRAVPLPQDTFQDLDFHGGGYVLLDPFTAGSVAFADATGRVRHEVSLVGEGVTEPGLVSAIFARADGTWAEIGHDYLVRLTDETGAPAEPRTRAEGRFVGAGGRTVEAFAEKPWGARIVRHERGDDLGKNLVQTTFSLPLLSLTGLEGTPDGSVYLGVKLHEDEVIAPFAIKRVEHWIIAYDAAGAEKDRVQVPEQAGPEEMFREMKAGRDGGIYAWTFTDQGVDIYRVYGGTNAGRLDDAGTPAGSSGRQP